MRIEITIQDNKSAGLWLFLCHAEKKSPLSPQLFETFRRACRAGLCKGLSGPGMSHASGPRMSHLSWPDLSHPFAARVDWELEGHEHHVTICDNHVEHRPGILGTVIVFQEKYIF